jgi:hypothetical protein
MFSNFSGKNIFKIITSVPDRRRGNRVVRIVRVRRRHREPDQRERQRAKV